MSKNIYRSTAVVPLLIFCWDATSTIAVAVHVYKTIFGIEGEENI